MGAEPTRGGLLWRLGALGALVGKLFGCAPSSHVTLPDSRYASAWFTPSGDRMVVGIEPAGQAGRVYLYDVTAKRVVWDLPARGRIAAVFSPRGEYFVLVEQRIAEHTATLSVRQINDGSRTLFARVLGSPGEIVPPFRYTYLALHATSVSDGGDWVALAFEPGSLTIHAVADGSVLYKRKSDARIDRVAFEPGGSRAAVLWREADKPRVRVVGRLASGWAESAVIEDASTFAWIQGGLGVLTSAGIAVWNGTGTRVAVPLTQRKDDQSSYEIDSLGRPSIFFSPDGAFAAAATSDRFDIFDLVTGVKIFSHHEPGQPSHPGLLMGADFVGGHMRGFLSTGDFVDVDLAGRRITSKISFGERGHYERNWFHEGSSWESNYVPTLGPGGRYLDLYAAGKGHTIYALP